MASGFWYVPAISAWALRAAHERGRSLRWVARGMQAPDHPVLPEVPETRYLKFALFQVE